MTKAHKCTRNFVSVLLVLGLAALLMPVAPAQAVGISLSAGAGAFVATDDEVYAGISTDLYPELGGALEFSMVRVGLKIGAIYRKIESRYYWDGYYDYEYTQEYTQAFLPVQFELLLAPMAGGKTIPTISPYFGGMLGAFLPVGDNDEIIPAFSLKAGADMSFDPLFIYGDVRYTHAPKDGWSYGGIMVVGGLGVRFGF